MESRKVQQYHLAPLLEKLQYFDVNSHNNLIFPYEIVCVLKNFSVSCCRISFIDRKPMKKVWRYLCRYFFVPKNYVRMFNEGCSV